MMTDRIVRAEIVRSAAPEPITPLSGSYGTFRKDPNKIPGGVEKADRAPNWNKWRLIPNLEPWQCAALWANIDPDKVKLIDHAWMARGSIHRFDESQEFKDRVELVEANQYDALKSKDCYTVDLRLFAAWVRETGWSAPPELLAMADEQVAIKADRAHSGKRTGAATATREAGKTDRLDDLRGFVKNLCTAVKQDGLVLEDGKPLPFAVDDLHTLFILRHREHSVSLSTFTDDLHKIDVKLKPGSKRYKAGDLANLLAGKFSG